MVDDRFMRVSFEHFKILEFHVKEDEDDVMIIPWLVDSKGPNVAPYGLGFCAFASHPSSRQNQITN